jgi:hypothetical protein
MKPRLVSQHFQNVADNLRAASKLVGLSRHAGTKGFGREAVAAQFLAPNMPSSIEFLTGEIVDGLDNRSGQIDIILFPKTAPKLHLFGATHLVFVDLVTAAIEVKSSLSGRNFDDALQSCKRVKELVRRYPISALFPHGEVQLRETPFIVFAYDGPNWIALHKRLCKQTEDGMSLTLLPDVFVNLSKPYIALKCNGWSVERIHDEEEWIYNDDHDTFLTLAWAYVVALIEAQAMTPKFTPFSDLLRTLVRAP